MRSTVVGGGGDVAVPVPVAATFCGLPVPLLVTVIVAPRAPTAAGVKVTAMPQLAPGFNVVQLVDTANSNGALLTTLATVTAVPPVLLTVTVLAALVAPTSSGPKSSDPVSVSCPGGGGTLVPVPLAEMSCGLPAPLL